MSGCIIYHASGLWAAAAGGYGHVHRLSAAGVLERTWIVCESEESEAALIEVGGMSCHAGGMVIVDRGLHCLQLVPWPNEDKEVVEIAETVDLAGWSSDLGAVSVGSERIWAVSCDRGVLLLDRSTGKTSMHRMPPGERVTLSDLEWVGSDLYVLQVGSPTYYVQTAESRGQWAERVLAGVEEIAFCSGHLGDALLLAKSAEGWQVMTEEGGAVPVDIQEGTEPVRFLATGNVFVIVEESNEASDQWLAVHARGDGRLIQRSPLS